MGDDKVWRDFLSSLKDGDLEGKIGAPEMESVPKLPKGTEEPQQTVYVQKMITEVYIYTDIAGNAFGQQTFQTSYQLGEMSAQKLMNMIEKERRKKGKS